MFIQSDYGSEEMEGTRRIVKGHRSEFPTSSVSLNRANLDY